MSSRAIFRAMLGIGSITLVARALFLAVVGFVVASSAAFAHGGVGTAISDPPAAQIQTAAKQNALDTQSMGAQLTKALRSDGRPDQTGNSGDEPCSDDGPGGHSVGDCCCKVACHSALATLTAEPTGTGDPASKYIAGLSDMLVGLPADSAERPPKRS